MDDILFSVTLYALYTHFDGFLSFQKRMPYKEHPYGPLRNPITGVRLSGVVAPAEN